MEYNILMDQELTVGEEFPKHECMIGFRVIPRQTDIFVHIEGNYIPEAKQGGSSERRGSR